MVILVFGNISEYNVYIILLICNMNNQFIKYHFINK